MMKYKWLSVRLPKEVKDELKEAAIEEMTSLSGMALILIINGLKALKRKKK